VVEGDADAVVEADRLFLRQALVNILHNAVRYSPVGSLISISVRREAGDVVLEVNRQPINSVADYRKLSRSLKKGDRALLRVRHGQQSAYVPLTVK